MNIRLPYLRFIHPIPSVSLKKYTGLDIDKALDSFDVYLLVLAIIFHPTYIEDHVTMSVLCAQEVVTHFI